MPRSVKVLSGLVAGSALPAPLIPLTDCSPDRWRELPVARLRRSLLDWYAHHGRELPWRRTEDLYAIWVSEIMLQQTQVKTVIPYYERWLQAFPAVGQLAQANQQTVLMNWQGLGYYARARNLHRAAQSIIADYGGQFPEQMADVLKLPGIGRTTAGGILSAALNQPYPILDGNVKRVLARLIGLSVPPNHALSWLWEGSETLLDATHPRAFNQALMDLGATVCTPKQPQCDRCPWATFCQAHQLNLQSVLPMSETRQPLPHKRIGVAVIWNSHGQILIDKRPQSGLLGGLWEFPGGKVEPNETIPECIAREIQEELGIQVEVGEHLITLDHAYTHFKVTLSVHHCRHLSGEPQPIECDEVKWVSLGDLDQYPFPTANHKIIAALQSGERPFR
ncbi:MAG: A/G-specific adenine glycosylase [Thermosynechococcaceae cyanobacterium MS004]|nr:A/G-specific adenine glycosylase [Thermosynechococcaceae cyanobacterium MS004]